MITKIGFGVSLSALGKPLPREPEYFLEGHPQICKRALGKRTGADDHDETQCYDTSSVKPGPYHPGAVLVNLKPLDIIVRQEGADSGYNGQYADEYLGLETSTEGVASNHQSTNIG